MGLVLVTPPSIEPVTLAQMKDQCRITDDSQNDRLTRYIVSARAYAENRLGRQLVNATWRLTLDRFPYCTPCITIPRPPLVSVTSFQYLDTNGDLATLPTDQYYVDADTEPGRIALKPNCFWPGTYPQISAVRITFVAGYGTTASSVPQDVLHAIEMMAAHFYEHREATSEAKLMNVPMAVNDLLDLHRVEQYMYPSEKDNYRESTYSQTNTW